MILYSMSKVLDFEKRKGKRSMETVYIAGGCLWGVQHFFDSLPGVQMTEAGRANGQTNSLDGEYDGYAECVKVIFDEKLVSITNLMDYFTFNIVSWHTVPFSAIVDFRINLARCFNTLYAYQSCVQNTLQNSGYPCSLQVSKYRHLLISLAHPFSSSCRISISQQVLFSPCKSSKKDCLTIL